MRAIWYGGDMEQMTCVGSFVSVKEPHHPGQGESLATWGTGGCTFLSVRLEKQILKDKI